MSARGRVAACASTSRATASARVGEGVTRMTCAAASCSAWLSRSAATMLGIGAVVGDDQQLARAGGHVDGGAAGQGGDHASSPRPPRRCRVRTSCRRAGSSPAPKARAAIACAPPTVQIASMPHRSAARAMTGSSPPSGRGGVTTTISSTPAAPRRNGEHQQGREQRRLAARNVEADRVDRPPDLADDEARHGLDLMLGGEAALVEGRMFCAARLIARELLGGQRPPRLLGQRRDRHQLRRGAVDPLGLLDHRVPAARPHVLDDRAHGRLQRRVAALLGTGEGGVPLRRRQRRSSRAVFTSSSSRWAGRGSPRRRPP